MEPKIVDIFHDKLGVSFLNTDECIRYGMLNVARYASSINIRVGLFWRLVNKEVVGLGVAVVPVVCKR